MGDNQRCEVRRCVMILILLGSHIRFYSVFYAAQLLCTLRLTAMREECLSVERHFKSLPCQHSTVAA